MISIHASAKEATMYTHTPAAIGTYFNPRLREGGDWAFHSFFIPANVISIHASAKEATLYNRKDLLFRDYFNPRLREGGDKFSGKVMPWII